MKAYASTFDVIGPSKPAKSPTATKLIEIRPKTVPISSVSNLSVKLGIPSAELLTIIGIPERTAIRRKEEGYLKLDEADRLFRVARVFSEAVRVFGSESKAAGWLKDESAALTFTPLSLLDSDAGAQAVSNELIRIDFGDFA